MQTNKKKNDAPVQDQKCDAKNKQLKEIQPK